MIEEGLGDVMSEQIFLGSILLDSSLMHEAVELIGPQDLYLQSHKKIYETMLGLYENSEPVEIGSVFTSLRQNGELKEQEDWLRLGNLTDGVSRTDSIAYYAKLIKEQAIKRAIARAATRIIDMAFEGGETMEFVTQAQRMFWDACDAHLPSGFVPLGAAAFKYLEQIEAMQGRGDTFNGLPTGFCDLDSRLLGLQKQDLVIFAARPSVGKTTLAFNIARHVSQLGIPVAFFSIEMGVERIGEKAVSLGARVDSSLMRMDRIETQMWQRIYDVARGMDALPFFVCDNARATSVEIKAKSQRMKREHGLGLIVVDYLQLMHGDRRISKAERVGENVKDMKAIAKELDVPILLLSQMNREIENRGEGAEPQLSDLGESGEIERTADVIVFLYNQIANTVKLKIAKNRTGATGNLQLTYLKHLNQFANIAL